MFKKTTLASLVLVSLLAGCSTTVVKDQSGSKIVDVLHAHYAEKVLQAMNRIADSEDRNTVNVLTPYNRNTVPLEQSYSGTVTAQRKIIMPDTYPQKDWRDDEKQTVRKVSAQQVMNDANLTPTAKAQVVAQGNDLTTQNGRLISQNKDLRDDIKTTKTNAKLAITQSEKEVEAARLAALQEKQRIETSLSQQVSNLEKQASGQISNIQQAVPTVKATAANTVNTVQQATSPAVKTTTKARQAVVVQ